MKNDFELIVHKLSTDLDSVNIYAIGDLHIGSTEFDNDIWNTWKNIVLNDEKGYVVIVGDLLDNGLKNSKTNSYCATMSPRQQKDWLIKELTPLKNKILGVCRGNHELRSVNEVDDCPLYDVMCKLDLEDLYRENMAFLKINLGYKNKERQYSYTMVLGHGASKNKTDKFSYSIDGMDILVTGHTHSPSSNFPSKIVIDSKNEIVKLVGYTHLVVPSFSKYGGYALRNMYMPQSSNKIPIIQLNGGKKEVKIIWT